MSTLRSNVSFIRLFLGRLVTNAGDSLYILGAMWLVYELTGSSFYTGIAGFLVQLPVTLQFLFGPLVDKWDLRYVLVGTQVVQGVGVLIIPFAAATGHLSVWVVLIVLPILSLLNQFVYPAQNAILPRIVEEDQLVRANSLFTTAYQGVDASFKAVGGLILAATTTMTLFVVDSVTFAIALLMFLGLNIPEAEEDAEDDETDENYLAKLREGIGYVRGSVLVAIMVGSMATNLGTATILAVLPAFADSVGGAMTYGLLTAAITAGPLVGSASASLFEDFAYGRVSVIGFALTGILLFAAMVVPGLPATLGLLLLAFVPVGVFNVMFQSILQSTVDESLLGRISSVTYSGSVAMVPIGYVLGGTGGDLIGPGLVMRLVGGVYLLAALYFFVKPKVRSLPPVDEADETTLDFQSPSGQ